MKISEKDKVFSDLIKAKAMSGDDEVDHSEADKLLCELLMSIGCTQTVEAFNDVKKLYA